MNPLVALAYTTAIEMLEAGDKQRGGKDTWEQLSATFHKNKADGHSVWVRGLSDFPEHYSHNETAIDHQKRVVMRELMALHQMIKGFYR